MTRVSIGFLMDLLCKNTAIKSETLQFVQPHLNITNIAWANRQASFATDWAVGSQSWQLDILTGAQLHNLTT